MNILLGVRPAQGLQASRARGIRNRERMGSRRGWTGASHDSDLPGTVRSVLDAKMCTKPSPLPPPYYSLLVSFSDHLHPRDLIVLPGVQRHGVEATWSWRGAGKSRAFWKNGATACQASAKINGEKKFASVLPGKAACSWSKVAKI